MRVSFAQLDQRTDRLADALARHGVGSGDRVAMLLLDGLPVIELLIAGAKLGAIAVLLNWRLAAPELAFILESADPRVLICAVRHRSLFSQTGVAIPCITIPGTARTDGPYEELIAGSAPLPSSCVVHDDEPLFMLYTSGTTGRPKGCLHSHRGTWIAALGLGLRLGVSGQDRLISTAPLFHVGGLSHVFAALIAGASTIFVPRGMPASDVLHLIAREGCTFGSPHDALIGGLVESQRCLRLPLGLRVLTRGASLTPPHQIRSIGDDLGAAVIGGYGQTEIGGFATMISGSEMLEAPASIGRPLAHLQAAILRADGMPDTSASSGELGLRGPSVMLGYWNDPQATSEALGTGWLRTGDLVRRDATGRYHFEGRSKELIKSGGENIYPREVELVLLQHPAIADAAVVGVPHPGWGEAVKACVVLRPEQSLSSADIILWCRQHLAGYKRPRFIEYVDAIPRDPLNKIQRPLLRSRPVTRDQAID